LCLKASPQHLYPHSQRATILILPRWKYKLYEHTNFLRYSRYQRPWKPSKALIFGGKLAFPRILYTFKPYASYHRRPYIGDGTPTQPALKSPIVASRPLLQLLPCSKRFLDFSSHMPSFLYFHPPIIDSIRSTSGSPRPSPGQQLTSEGHTYTELQNWKLPVPTAPSSRLDVLPTRKHYMCDFQPRRSPCWTARAPTTEINATHALVFSNTHHGFCHRRTGSTHPNGLHRRNPQYNINPLPIEIAPTQAHTNPPTATYPYPTAQLPTTWASTEQVPLSTPLAHPSLAAYTDFSNRARQLNIHVGNLLTRQSFWDSRSRPGGPQIKQAH
jgi:hypothetical protein